MLIFHKSDNNIIAELVGETLLIAEVQQVLDIMGDCSANNCNTIIIRKQNFHPDFFRLHTGLAGEILQKFSTYDFRLAVVGDFSEYKSEKLKDFIRESNKGNRIFFLSDLEGALKELQKSQF
jgi:hypothetical protein